MTNTQFEECLSRPTMIRVGCFQHISRPFRCLVSFTPHSYATPSYPATSWRTGAISVSVRTLRTTNTPHLPRTATQTSSPHQHRNARYTAFSYHFSAFTHIETQITFWFVVCFKLKALFFLDSIIGCDQQSQTVSLMDSNHKMAANTHTVSS